MAKKIKVNKVTLLSPTSLRLRMYVTNNILPYRWVDFIASGQQTLEFWYRAGEDPTESSHTAVVPDSSDVIKDGKYTRMYGTASNLTPGVKYHIVGTGLGTVPGTANIQRFYSAVTIATPTSPGVGQPLFQIYSPNGWEDFTDCIPVPEYKVNNTDISEEWEDANYNTHSGVVQTRIKGSVSLKFRTRARLNAFLNCLQYNEQEFGRGRARLIVQVNNELDLEGVLDISSAQPNTYEDFFKIEWEPDWSLPFYGSSNDYNAITVNISEIEE